MWIMCARDVFHGAECRHSPSRRIRVRIQARPSALQNRLTWISLQSHSAHPTNFPRILHLPVFATSVRSVSNGKDTVVELRAAGSVQHTRRVRLKQWLVCLNGDGHRLLCHCQCHSMLAVDGHVRVLDDSTVKNVHLATRQTTCTVCCGVKVTSFGCELTVTTGIDRATVHELLFARNRHVAVELLPWTRLARNFVPRLAGRIRWEWSSNWILGRFQGSLNVGFDRIPHLRDKHSHIPGRCSTRLAELPDSTSGVMLEMPGSYIRTSPERDGTEACSFTSLLSHSFAVPIHWHSGFRV